MKAVIVEKNKKYAIALDKNGAFIKIRSKGSFDVGSEIELPPKPVVSIGTVQKLSSIAAAVLLVVSLGLGVYGYTTPYSYINIDINPSVEITSNVFDRIIKVEALNTDAAKIIESVDYKHKTINEGIDMILNKATQTGYLKDETKNAVMITVSGKNEDKVGKIKKNVEEEARTELKTQKVSAEVLVENVNVQKHNDARKAGISPGKLLLIERLQEVDPKAKVEDYKDAPVKEIMKNIQSAKKQEQSQKKEDKGSKDDKNNNENKGAKGFNENKDTHDDKADNALERAKTANPSVHNRINGANKNINSNKNNDKTQIKGNTTVRDRENNDKTDDSRREEIKKLPEQKENGRETDRDSKNDKPDKNDLKNDISKEKKDRNWKWPWGNKD